ncbi:DUF1493 family protein [Pseudomonas amygdali]|uniref:DUF1493 family protein n=1 Tax=Pseudomonas amygdali TaxID=47877 RepID=UPI000E3D0952|nr:DUF1493 family protein [Pseudomonas amygdali]
MSIEIVDYGVIDFIVNEIDGLNGFDRRAFETFSLASDVQNDLDVDGHDAFELMEHLFEHYEVDFEGYDHFRYFKPESFDIYNLFRPKHRRGQTPIYIGMLHEAVRDKVWDQERLEARTWTSTPLYSHKSQIPLQGFDVSSK